MKIKKVILLKYGEIALRGKNRYIFENNLADKARAITGMYVKKEQGRLLVENPDGDVDFTLTDKLSTIFGIVGICPCIMFEDSSIQTLCENALSYIKERFDLSKPHSFKVFAKRANKRYPLTSNEIAADVGAYILQNLDNFKVDVNNPEIKIFIELRNNVYIYSDTVKGLGGLPVGTSGKGMLLLSGGFDSPVSGYMMAKRGVEISAVYFHSPPYTARQALQKVTDLAERLSVYAGNVKLFVFPFTDIQMFLNERVQAEKLTIILKRTMLRISEIIAKKEACRCLITGDSVGQVASQTLMSIEAVNSAVTLPILRPLAGLDKQDIMDIAQKIGTYEISKRPYDDCCTLFVAKHPETKPKASIIESIEKRLEDELMPMIEEGLEKCYDCMT